MLIVFGNQKGGAGKSTLATLFANQLSVIKRREVILLDMDYQKSILEKYNESKVLENPELYQVIGAELTDFPALYSVLSSEENAHQIVIIDLPGKIDDDNLLPILTKADIFVIPFAYEKMTYQSTLLFSLLVDKLNPKSHKIFVPNRIKSNVRLETKESIDSELEKFGVITEMIPDKIDFQRITTKDIPTSLLQIIETSFEPINKLI